MFGTNWYFGLTRKFVALFGALFQDIQVVRYDTSGQIDELLHVPIEYAPREKVLARLTDPNITREAAVQLPRMSFEITDLRYDGDRKLTSTGKRVSEGDPSVPGSTYKWVFNPVPYNLSFALHVYAHNTEDGLKIVEQILPMFPPEFTVTAELIPEMDIDVNLPIILKGVSMEDTYDGDFKQRRALVWTLDFDLKGYYWGPVVVQPVIKFANVSFYIPHTNTAAQGVGITTPSERVTVQPGLTANGKPTSNVSQSIAYGQINADDDFGFIVTVSNLELGEDTGGDQSNNLPYQG